MLFSLVSQDNENSTERRMSARPAHLERLQALSDAGRLVVATSKYEEGCLSVPDQFAEIERPNECEVEYLDYNGNKQLLKADGLLATCIQHEMDHLEGVLFIDYLSKLKKSMIIKKLSKIKSNRIIV